MEFGEVPMAVILWSFQSCWTIRLWTGPAQAKGYCPVYKAGYTTTLIPVQNGRLSTWATLASHGRQAVKWVATKLASPPPGQPLPVIWARTLRDQTRANGQQPRLLKRPRLSYTINRFDTTKYFKMNKKMGEVAYAAFDDLCAFWSW